MRLDDIATEPTKQNIGYGPLAHSKVSGDVVLFHSVMSHGSNRPNIVIGEFGVQPTVDIDLSGDGFEMIGIDTSPNAAQVVNLETFRNRSNFALVHRTMHLGHIPVDPDRPVSLLVGMSLPYPTRSRVTTILDHVTVKATTGFTVVGDIGKRFAFDVSLLGASSVRDSGLLTTSALTESVGNVTVWAHCQVLSDGAALPVVPATREFFVA